MQNHSSDYKNWLVLSQLSSLTPAQWLTIAANAKISLAELCDASDEQWVKWEIASKLIDKRSAAVRSAVLADRALEQDESIQCICYGDNAYPQSLLCLPHPPPTLFVKGALDKLHSPQVAIVGSRHATANGKSIAASLANHLSLHNIVVTSGLARGIDASAHQGAVGNGNTLAVLGSGVDVCYPKYNQHLYQQILSQGGALVSEFLPGTPPRAYHFPRRNRLVAALSQGVLVVEAKIRSGSLITANLAADLGKEVFAVPGNINHPLSEGVNWLIQQGAKLVTSHTDILEELGVKPIEVEASISVKKPLARAGILDSVDYDATSLSDITKRSKLSRQAVLTALLEYELRGLVAAVPGGYVKLRGK